MCGPKIKMPEVPEEDPALKHQLDLKMRQEREVRSQNKQARFEEVLANMGGFGRRGLITGSRGGIGFSGRSLLR